MKLTSTVFKHNQSIPTPYTCDGSEVNPPLRFEDVPPETRSLTLIMEDPDVPHDMREDGMWDHWIVFNIPPYTKVIPEGHEPRGVFGTGTGGSKEYQGPCPPDKEHRYVFKLFALDTQLRLLAGAKKLEVEKAMEGHVIEQAELIGRYKRKI